MQVLIVEEDRSLALFLQKGLTLEGHEVTWVASAALALEQLAQQSPDLMVLDLGQAVEDEGTAALELLEGSLQRTSTLVLTARADAEHRVRCLDLGADDCLLKPFSFGEFTARCRAILRRRGQAQDAVLRLGELSVDRMQRTVHSFGNPLELTGKEFALLEYLLLRRGAPCSRGELLQNVWGVAADSVTNVVDVYINYLRRKLGGMGEGDAMGAARIETVRGKGYRLLQTVPAAVSGAVVISQTSWRTA